MPDDLTTMTVEELEAHRDGLVAEAETLLERADSTLEGDDADRFATLETELEHCNRHLTVRHAAGRPGSLERGDGSAGAPNVNGGRTRTSDPWRELHGGHTRDADLVGIATAAIERAQRIDDDSRQHATELVEAHGTRAAEYVAATSQPAYASAWWKIVADPVTGQHRLTEAERAAMAVVMHRAQSLTDAAGGYAVPFTLDPTLILTNAGTNSPMREVATIRTTVTDQWQGVTTAGVTASWDGEATEVSDDSPTLDDAPIPVHKAQAFVPFSIEIGQDWANHEAEMREVLEDARTNLEAPAFVTGNGTNRPTGIITALDGTASEVAPTTAETFAKADVYKLASALPERAWANARWMANRSVGFLIRGFADGDDSGAFWADLGEGTPPNLIGKRFHENSEMDGSWDTAATADNFALLLGNFARYVIVDRIGTSIELVPHLFGANGRPTGQRGFYMHFRVGGAPTDVNAFRVLNIATTA